MASVIYVFFSSRRRHTRCSRDWSSDVCSSDLGDRDRGRAGRHQGLLRETRARLQGEMSQERGRELREKALKGGTRYLPKLREQHKLTARERLNILLDEGSLIEDGLFANVVAEDLPADGVVTGLGTIEGR